MTGTPINFSSWWQSSVWDDAVRGTKESKFTWEGLTFRYYSQWISTKSEMHSTDSKASKPLVMVMRRWRCTFACALGGAPTSCLSSLLKLQEKQALQSARVASCLCNTTDVCCLSHIVWNSLSGSYVFINQNMLGDQGSTTIISTGLWPMTLLQSPGGCVRYHVESDDTDSKVSLTTAAFSSGGFPSNTKTGFMSCSRKVSVRKKRPVRGLQRKIVLQCFYKVF